MKKKKEVNRIFVYGSLRKKHAPFPDLIRARRMKHIGKGKIRAKLYDLGEYPSAVECKENHVYGEVYEIANMGKVLPLLDEYEEFDPNKPTCSLFVRKTSRVLMENGRETVALVYFFNKDVGRARIIPTGVWGAKN